MCTFLASKFAARFARNTSIHCLYIYSSILLNLQHDSHAYHNFTPFCTFLALKFAARNSSIYCLYIYSSILLNSRAYHNFTQFCTFLASKFAARFPRNSSIYCLYIYGSILLNFHNFIQFLHSYLQNFRHTSRAIQQAIYYLYISISILL